MVLHHSRVSRVAMLQFGNKKQLNSVSKATIERRNQLRRIWFCQGLRGHTNTTLAINQTRIKQNDLM